MLFSVFISFLAVTLNILSAPLPSGPILPANFPSMLQDIIDFMWGLDWIFPTGTFLTVISIAVGLVLVEHIIRRIFKVISFFKR